MGPGNSHKNVCELGADVCPARNGLPVDQFSERTNRKLDSFGPVSVTTYTITVVSKNRLVYPTDSFPPLDDNLPQPRKRRGTTNSFNVRCEP